MAKHKIGGPDNFMNESESFKIRQDNREGEGSFKFFFVFFFLFLKYSRYEPNTILFSKLLKLFHTK